MNGIALDLTITFGNIIEIGVIAIGGISAIAVMKSNVVALRREVWAAKKETGVALSEMRHDTKEQFAAIQSKIKTIGDILVNQADQNRRIIHLEDDYRELRRGHGWIQGPAGVDREYK